MDWQSTEEKPLALKPMQKLKDLVDRLPGQFKKAKTEIKTVKDGRIQKASN